MVKKLSPMSASYDFVVLPRRNDMDLIDDVESRVVDPPAGFPHERAARDAMVSLLRDLHPSLEPFMHAVDLDLGPQAPTRLVGPDGRGAVHVAVHDDHVTVSMPYWESEDAARVTLRHAWEYFKVIRLELPFEIYDVQDSRIVDPTRDFEEVLASYLLSAGRVRDAATNERAPQALTTRV